MFSWPEPESREVALFTDLSLYAEALMIAQEYGSVTVPLLQQELKKRMFKMRLIEEQKERTMERLLRELRFFKWLEPKQEISGKRTIGLHLITSEGQYALKLSMSDQRAFRRLLTEKMQQVYTIPGWFIDRLWKINPEGQGEVILPDPPDEWRPKSWKWDDIAWNEILLEQTLAAVQRARNASPHAFPIHEDDWVDEVQKTWDRLSSLKPRRSGNQDPPASYRPRSRLSLAMREASVRLMFNRVPYGEQNADFPGHRPPVYLRTFNGWCPRLESLEMIFYTDWHPLVSGRLLFPTSVFRSNAPEDQFEPLSWITRPDRKTLHLYQPTWQFIRSTFLTTLIAVYQYQSIQSGTLYVSLLNIRDEVCRQLRLSSICFDDFLKQAVQELPTNDFSWSIAVETDIREEQRSGFAQLRRPVYLDLVPHTLIALARLSPPS
jgi:hypothetical protein